MSVSSLLVSREAAPVRAQVLENLRAAIVEQRFLPGDRLREKDLCELTGTSRTSVREALRQLESEGLVTVLANIGPVVATVTLKGARDIYEVRAALEGLAGKLFAERASASQVLSLEELVSSFANTQLDQDRLELKDRFYQVLLEGAANPEVTSTLMGLRARISVLRATTLSRPGRFDETVKELNVIIAAIKSRDGIRTEAACRAHVEAALKIAVVEFESHAETADFPADAGKQPNKRAARY
jgi:DNA-binding GntR family transcriptional regulator